MSVRRTWTWVAAVAVVSMLVPLAAASWMSASLWPFKPQAPSLYVDTAVVEHSGDYVGITWTNLDAPADDDFLAIYSPSTAADNNWLGTILLNTSSTWASGKGRVLLPFVNMRQDFQVRLWSGPGSKTVTARSENITFRNPGVPTQVHLSLAAVRAPAVVDAAADV